MKTPDFRPELAGTLVPSDYEVPVLSQCEKNGWRAPAYTYQDRGKNEYYYVRQLKYELPVFEENKNGKTLFPTPSALELILEVSTILRVFQ